MEPTTALLGAGLLGAGGSIFGSMLGSDSAEKAAKLQMYGANRSANTLNAANRNAMQMYQPYSDYGLNALPFAQSGIMGIQPEPLTEQELAQIETLSGQVGNVPGGLARSQIKGMSLQEAADFLNQKMDLAGTTHSTRHWGEAYGPAQAQVNRQLQQLDELKRRQQIQKVYEQGGGDGGTNQFVPTMERETGYLNALDSLRGGETDLTASPIYQAKQRELERSLNRKYAGMGNLYSSGADDAMLRNQGGLMEQEYGRQYGGLTDSYNMASGLSGRKYGQLLDAIKVGAGAAGQAGQSSLATAGQVGSNYMQGANAAAQGTLASGNIMSNMFSNLGALPMQGLALNNQMGANNALAKYYGGGGQPGGIAYNYTGGGGNIA